MPATRQVQIGERTITVRELTFAEVRDWLVETEAGADQDPLHALALDDCGLADLTRMCDASAAEFESCTPSDIAPLVDAAKKLNPHFFRVRAALSGVARLMLSEAQQLASSAPPASS